MSRPNDAVLLRAVVNTDLPVFFENQRDPAARRMAAFGTMVDDWAAFEARWHDLLAKPDAVMRTIEVNGSAAGYIAQFQHFGQPSISYWLGRRFWGRGITTRALGLFVAAIAERPLFARAAADNLGSLRVLEQCGFHRIGTEQAFSDLRGEEVEEIVLTLTEPHPHRTSAPARPDGPD